MQKPDLTNCIDAVVPLDSASIADYLQKLRNKCAPAVRTLQAENAIAWFSFLIHDRAGADRQDLPRDFPEQFIHFRFSPANGTPSAELLGRLKEPFLHPIHRTLGAIGGLIPTAGGWPEAWWLIGEASDWVLRIIETHPDGFCDTAQFVQFLHYITNSLGIGMQSIFIPKSCRF